MMKDTFRAVERLYYAVLRRNIPVSVRDRLRQDGLWPDLMQTIRLATVEFVSVHGISVDDIPNNRDVATEYMRHVRRALYRFLRDYGFRRGSRKKYGSAMPYIRPIAIGLVGHDALNFENEVERANAYLRSHAH